MNAALEPLRAAKTLASPAAAEVTITGADRDVIARLRGYGAELAAFLIVAKVDLAEGGRRGELAVTVRPTALVKCERCWMHRDGRRPGGRAAGLCARCVTALESAGK